MALLHYFSVTHDPTEVLEAERHILELTLEEKPMYKSSRYNRRNMKKLTAAIFCLLILNITSSFALGRKNVIRQTQQFQPEVLTI